MNKDTAAAFCQCLENMIEQANHALFLANNSGDEKLKSRTQEVLGAVVAELDLELLPLVHKEHPELKRPSLT
jgi:hypothetical protein